MTKRAEKLGNYLVDAFGWSVFDFKYACSKCNHKDDYGTPKFCEKCGSRMRKIKKKEPILELEEALKHALGE